MSESESIENSTDFEPASLRLADFATFELQLSLISWVSVTVATQHRPGSCQAVGSIIEFSFPIRLVPPEASNDSDDDLKKVGVDLGKACQQVQLDCFTLKFLEFPAWPSDFGCLGAFDNVPSFLSEVMQPLRWGGT